MNENVKPLSEAHKEWFWIIVSICHEEHTMLTVEEAYNISQKLAYMFGMPPKPKNGRGRR